MWSKCLDTLRIAAVPELYPVQVSKNGIWLCPSPCLHRQPHPSNFLFNTSTPVHEQGTQQQYTRQYDRPPIPPHRRPQTRRLFRTLPLFRPTRTNIRLSRRHHEAANLIPRRGILQRSSPGDAQSIQPPRQQDARQLQCHSQHQSREAR